MASKPWELTKDDILKLYDDKNWRVFDSDVYRALAAGEVAQKKLIEWLNDLEFYKVDSSSFYLTRRKMPNKNWQELMED